MAGIKFFNVFGPNEYHKADMRSMVCKAVGQIREKGALTLFKSHRTEFGDGMQMRDFIYIKDCVAVMIWLLEHHGVNGIFNLGSGQARTWNDLAAAVFAAMELPARLTYVDMPADIRNQYQYFTQAPMAKLRNAGYTHPFTPLEQSVHDYVRDYLLANRYLDAGA
jgi:ADP-L-glycero-D-manno-heptose 6-epimerase